MAAPLPRVQASDAARALVAELRARHVLERLVHHRPQKNPSFFGL